jgi:hypothetical protein
VAEGERNGVRNATAGNGGIVAVLIQMRKF